MRLDVPVRSCMTTGVRAARLDDSPSASSTLVRQRGPKSAMGHRGQASIAPLAVPVPSSSDDRETLTVTVGSDGWRQ